jgi:hypothetical protein
VYFLLTKRFDLHAEHDGEKEEVQAREPALLQSLQRRLVAILEGRDELCCSCDRGSGVRRPHHTASSPAKSRLHTKNKEHLCPCGRFRGVHCDAAGDQEAEWYPTRMVSCIVSSEERRPTIPRTRAGSWQLSSNLMVRPQVGQVRVAGGSRGTRGGAEAPAGATPLSLRPSTPRNACRAALFASR